MIENAGVMVFATTRFVGFHNWPGAPEQFAHLKSPHRHVFHVKVKVLVQHNERDVEFQYLKTLTEKAIKELAFARPLEKAHPFSCETMAQEIGKRLNTKHKLEVVEVSVDEDGENGSIVLFTMSQKPVVPAPKSWEDVC